MSRSGRDRFALAIAPSPGQRRGWTAQMINFLTGIAARETLLYRGGVVSSFFITVRSLSSSSHTPSREVLASLRGRRDGRHMMGSEGEAEQSESRPAEAESRSLRTRLVHRPREGCVSAEAELGVLRYAAAVSASLRQRNSVPSTHMRCMTTARRRARVTFPR